MKLLTIFLCFFISLSAHAFIFITGTNYGIGQRPISEAPVWKQRTVTFVVNDNLTAYSGGAGVALDVSASEFLNAAQLAVNAWVDACRADIKVEIAGTTPSKKSASDQVNTISYDNRATGSNMFPNANVIATSYSALTNNSFFDCDIVVNGDNSGDLSVNPGGGQIDLVSVLTHEVGHCLGLDHPVSSINAGVASCPGTGEYCSDNTFLQQSSMVQTGALPSGGLGDVTRRDINQDDIDGIECLYERGKSFRKGNSCSSYHGTGGSGVLEGVILATLGPQAADSTPRLCSTEGDASTTRLSSEKNGMGCITSAIASDTHTENKKSPYYYLGSVWGFIFLIGFFVFFKTLFRRKKKPSAWLWILGVGLLGLTRSTPVKADPIEFDLSYHRLSPKLWNHFSEMNTNPPSAWSSAPKKSDLRSFIEPSVSYLPWNEPWGLVGLKFTFTLPKTQKSSGTPQGLAPVTKETSLWGFRVGPTARYQFTEGHGVFIDGNVSVGLWQAHQQIDDSKLSAQAYAFEMAMAIGYDFKPSASTSVFAKIGVSYLNSSYFSSRSGTGKYYSDYYSGARLAVSGPTLGSQEELKLKASGVFAAIGFRFGEAHSTGSVSAPLKAEPASPPQRGIDLPPMEDLPDPPPTAPSAPQGVDPVPDI